jgi:hypothetical protein
MQARPTRRLDDDLAAHVVALRSDYLMLEQTSVMNRYRMAETLIVGLAGWCLHVARCDGDVGGRATVLLVRQARLM